MPYIITTTKPRTTCAYRDCERDPQDNWTTCGRHYSAGRSTRQGEARPITTCHAVATLDEAREHVENLATDRYGYARGVRTIPAEGRTVGPLPDGTVIEVERTTWHDLIDGAGGDFPQVPNSDDERREIIDAYNAAQEAS